MIRTLQLYPDDANELRVPFSQQAEPENRPILEERSLATPMNGRVRLDFFKIFIGGKVNVRDYNPLFDDPIACPHLLHLYNLQKDLSYTLTKASQVAGATY